MESEEGEGVSGTDAATSWQQYYTWCTPYPHPHHHHHPHPHQYQGGQYQQPPASASTINYSASQHQQQHQPQQQEQQQQQHHQHQQHQQQPHHHQMQLPSSQMPLVHQQPQYHPMRTAPRRAIPYEGPGDPMITSSLKGKQGKDGPEEKKDADGELWGNVEAQAAFLGPNLWDKTLPYDADLKYVDLDEFLSENGIPVDGVAGGGQGAMQSGGGGGGGGGGGTGQLHKMGNSEAAAGGGGHQQGPAGLHLEPVTKRERSPSPSECCSPDTLNPPSPADSTLSMASSGRDFDPRTRAFSDEELKPQPMIKKSRKQFVPDDLKDDKYWARRRKNNMAAKRSRDARRMKENQIALRAGFLEKENMGLRQELDRLKNENMLLRDKLSKYTDV